MDARLVCLADYVSALSELVVLLEADREDSTGVQSTWARAEKLLDHYRDLEATSNPPSLGETEELRALARRASGLNAIAANLAVGCLTAAKNELARCRAARERLRPRADTGSVGDICDLAG